MKHVITIRCLAVVTVALFATTATAEKAVAERSFGTPEMTLVEETEMKDRKVLRYEHESIPEWGYAEAQKDYFYLLPLTGKPENKPLHVVLHSAGHSGDAVLADAFAHPDWLHYVGSEDHNVLYLDCRKNQNDWWWGAHTIQGGGGKFDTNYTPTEKRVLTTIEWAITTCKADRNRVYLSGISMGGSGSLGIGMCRGDIFAAVNVAVPAGVDHIKMRMFNRKNIPDPPVLVNYSAPNDGWCKGQEDLIDTFRKNKYPLIFAWGPYGHVSSVAPYHPAALAFPWRAIRKDAAYPVFSNCSTDNRFPAFENASGGDPVGQIGALLRWTNISDQEDQFEIDLHLVKKADLKPAVEIPASSQTDISLRRLQRFTTESGKAYFWRLSQGGKTLQSGKAIADTAGLLTIEKLSLNDAPSRLTLHRTSETVVKPQRAQLDYYFDGRISRHVLENYLARSATVASLLHLTSDDDLRMMQNTGVKFAGRVIWMWGSESRIDALVEKGESFVRRIHEMDPDIVLQGAIFEIVTTDVNNIPIPAAVFEEFGQKPEVRNFRYEEMIYPMGHRVDHWSQGASVPDMSRLETRMWFVYVGKRWIDMGLEAIHFGQVEIMDDRDRDHAHWRDMMARLRSYAKQHARRHLVVADAHVPGGGIVHDGELMFDLHSFPSRPKSVQGKPYQAILEKGFSDAIYGRSVGGRTPSGWSCEALPYIVEIDNFGSSDHPGQYRESDRFHVWGWDEIGWFINQPEAYRNQWLEYAYRWVRETDPNGFFQLPLRRFEHYTASMTPPKGQRQEETIKAIWAASDRR